MAGQMSNTERKEFKMEEKTEEIRAEKVKAIGFKLAHWKRRIEEARDIREATEMYRTGSVMLSALEVWENSFDPEGLQAIEAKRATNDLWKFYRKKWLDK